MKRCSLPLLAFSSLILVIGSNAEVRPHYGGTLRVVLREQCPALDVPASPSCASISRLVFETLVQLDGQGHPQPLLAITWQSEPGSQRWRFQLRTGVSFHDGSTLDSTVVAASLRNANPEWKVVPMGTDVVIETASSDPDLPSELALPRNAIVRRGSGSLSGTGPFAIQSGPTGSHLSLAANDHYWAGRPFIDGVEADFGRSERDEMLALDVGKADVADLAPEDMRRARSEGRIVVSSEPAKLMALVFAAPPANDDVHFRNSLALAIDRAAINDVVLQGSGQPAASLLPNWLSGYAFTFSTGRNLEGARQEKAIAKRTTALTIGYEQADPIARVVAERIMLNARDIGITIQPARSSAGDVKLVQIPLLSINPQVALKELAVALGLSPPSFANGSIEELYESEKTLLQAHRVIPLLHLSSAAALRPGVHGLTISPDGIWDLSNTWLERP